MFKENLIMLRNIHGFSQEEIAEKIDISRQAYAKWESGATVPDIEKCKRLADIYGVTIDSLIKTETIDGKESILPAPKGALISADQVGKLPKDYYHRTRPYVYYDEPTIYPHDEEELRHNGSYPSGHTIEGWSAALLLTELNPDRADTILARGYIYGQSRVIAGYHWQSDVDAGRLAASAAIARLHADKRFQRLMKKARREYRRLAGKRGCE